MGVFRWEGVGEELDGGEEAKTIIKISLQEKIIFSITWKIQHMKLR